MEKISISDLIGQISVALDAVEADLFGAQPFHSKRVSTLSMAMGRKLGFDDKHLFSLGGAALLHDSALTEYILSERKTKSTNPNIRTHCLMGEDNASYFPFPSPVDGFVLYHHEFADGSGAFGKKAGEYPLEAEIIGLADKVDVNWPLRNVHHDTLQQIRSDIERKIGSFYTRQTADLALSVLDEELIESLQDNVIHETLRHAMPAVSIDLDDTHLMRISHIAAKIIDYKSTFTKMHSVQIADKAWYMSGLYGYDSHERAMIYVAASFHDIGKLFIPTEILEKPGRLTLEEFNIIKSHAQKTWDVLGPIGGFGTAAVWAGNHHEKLDGSGYPRGIDGSRLDFISRLMGCVDIYQAVREPRPYHDARSHEDTMAVVTGMYEKGLIDRKIAEDLGRELCRFPDGLPASPFSEKETTVVREPQSDKITAHDGL